jgi:hypothetical protein
VWSYWNRFFSAPRGSTTRWRTSELLKSARIYAREEAGDGLEGALGSLFGVFDAGGHDRLGFSDPKCDTICVVIAKAICHGKKKDIVLSHEHPIAGIVECLNGGFHAGLANAFGLERSVSITIRVLSVPK